MEQLVNIRVVFVLVILLSLQGCHKSQKEYYDNGNLKSDIKLNKENNYNGIASFYYEDGKLEKVVEYDNGFILKCTVYYENGQVMWQSPYLNNLKNGEYLEYYPNGEIKKKMNFREDTVISSIHFDTRGIITNEYVRVDTAKLPVFDESFVIMLQDSSVKKIQIKVPNVPSSQLMPEIINGETRVLDRVNGVWEVRGLNNTKPTYIGIRIRLDNDNDFSFGYNTYTLN